jgi:selenide,water dikinase
MEAFTLLPDPQTNGGLLFSVKEKSVSEVVALMESSGLKNFTLPIGRLAAKKEKLIEVKK